MRNWFSFPIAGILSFLLGISAVWVVYTGRESAPAEPTPCKPAVPASVEREPVAPVLAQPETPSRPTLSETESMSDIDIENPYELAYSIDGRSDLEMDALWRRLRVKSEYKDFFSTCNSCKADAFTFNLDDSPQNEVIVRIANGMEECRYLVFKQIDSDAEKYKLIANIDSNFGRYEMPSHHFVVNEGRAYLLVRVQTASGSGVATYAYRLFRVYHGRLEELLDFPADGHEAMSIFDPIREWSTRVRSITPISGGATRVELDLTINYNVEDYNGDGSIGEGRWTRRERAAYIKPAGNREARLDKRSSTVTEHQIESEFNIDSLDNNDLARYNRAQLRRIGWKPPKKVN